MYYKVLKNYKSTEIFRPFSSHHLIIGQCACAMTSAKKAQQKVPILKKDNRVLPHKVLLLYSIVLPVQNDQGFLSDDMVLVGGQLDHPVQEQGEQGGLRQDVAGGYQPCATTPSQVSTSIRIRIQRPSGSKSGYGSGFRSRYLKQLLLTSNQGTVLSNHH